MVSTPQRPVPRATRFSMNLPVRYRVQGEVGWSYGMTINISSTGLLFQSARRIEPDAEVEIEVVLPGDEAGSARVVSHGDVMRVTLPTEPDGDHVVAATFEQSDLVRSERVGA